MYYSRYFEGHVEETTASKIIYPLREGKGSSTTQFSYNTNKLKNAVIGNAIASTLRDCGLDARYVADNGYLYFDYENSNIGIFINSYASSTYYGQIAVNCGYGKTTYDYIYGAGLIAGSGVFISYINDVFSLSNNSSTANYLKATDYRFCVTIIGDTSSMFSIYLGVYSDPTALTYSIGKFLFGKDKRDDSDVFGFYIGESSKPWVNLISKDTLLLMDGTDDISYYTPASRLTLVDNNVVLIEQYFPTLPYIAMDNVFIDPGFNTSNKFYEIDGEIYMCSTPHFIKCTTPVIPTEG